jgi:hypothetical protein
MNTKYRQFFFDLRGRLLAGQISMEDAEREAAPTIAKMDASARMVAKKYGKRFAGFSFAALVR